MKNTKIKYKIFFLMMLLVISLNNVSGYEVYEGQVESTAYSQTTNVASAPTSYSSITMNGIAFKNGVLAKDLTSVTLLMDIDAWSGSSDYGYLKSDVEYKQSGIVKGTGYVYYWMQNTDSIPGYDYVFVKCYFDDGLDLATGIQHVEIVGSITTYMAFDRVQSFYISNKHEKTAIIGALSSGTSQFSPEGTHKAFHVSTFYNNYSYWYNEDLFNFVLTRNETNPSMLYINNQYIDLINESSYEDVTTNVYSDDIDNSTWDIEIYDINSITHSHQIDFIPEEEDLTPTLTTDKSLYNTSEQITISFTNIDEIEGYAGKSLSLYILYPIIDDYADYYPKYMLHLLGDRRDETFTLNTSFLSPQNEYHLAVCVDGDFYKIEDSIIISDTFYVYSDGEYINTNCDPTGNCYTYNGGDISIYYNINNNSNIIINDNEGNTIQTYYNIIGEGELNYYIPDDVNKLNSYPNWKFYLNNTEYETNYSTDVTIYWSLIATPEPTPIYTTVPIDENVSEMVDELKEESKPIFDLIYGLSELVVDNPDYDRDNIITENEMNNWFNSLIPIVLILLIFIVYTGLTKKR